MGIDLQKNLTQSNLFFIRLIGRRKSLKLSLICLITFILFYKHLRIIIVIFLESTIHANYCLTSMVRAHLKNFFIVKLCNFIIIMFYFCFEKFFIVDRFFFTSALTVSQVIYFCNNSSSSIKKYIHLVCHNVLHKRLF